MRAIEIILMAAILALLKRLRNLVLLGGLTAVALLLVNYPAWGYQNNEIIFNLLDSSISQVLVILSA